MMNKPIVDQVILELEDQKAINITPLDVRELTCITDHMVIASGTSTRHVRSITDNLVKSCRDRGLKPLRYERDPNGDWMLIDFGDVIVHVMHPRTRDFYNLEKLWGPDIPAPKHAEASHSLGA